MSTARSEPVHSVGRRTQLVSEPVVFVVVERIDHLARGPHDSTEDDELAFDRVDAPLQSG